jgi:hypothetical protein
LQPSSWQILVFSIMTWGGLQKSVSPQKAATELIGVWSKSPSSMHSMNFSHSPVWNGTMQPQTSRSGYCFRMGSIT